MTRRPRKRISLRRFQRLTVVFFGATVVVLAAVVYIALGRTTIFVTPAIQTPIMLLHLTVGPQPTEASETGPDVPGTVLTRDVTTELTWTEFASSEPQDARAGGKAVIVNTSAKTQPLQAGTRLLSETGVLYRTVEAIVSAPGSRTEVAVLADEVGQQGEIGPSKFEIVALWEGLKPQIYAESSAPMTGGTRSVTRLTQADLAAAEKRVREQLQSQTRKEVADLLAADPVMKSFSVLTTEVEKVVVMANAEVGQEVDRVVITAKGSANAVAVDKNAYEKNVRTLAEKNVELHMRLVDVDPAAATVTVKGVNTEKQTAALELHIEPRIIAAASHAIFGPTKLTNLSRAQIESRLRQFSEVASVDVRFSPFWVFRSPALADHIKVKLLDPKEKAL